jgi:hypothetical protein
VLLSWPAKIAVLLLFFGYLAVSIVGEPDRSLSRVHTLQFARRLQHPRTSTHLISATAVRIYPCWE